MKNKKIKSYTQAMNDLQEIIQQLQENKIPMDILPEKVKYATALISYCKERLRKTEEELGR